MLTNHAHEAPVLLTVEVSTDGKTWHAYLPAEDGTWDNPTTEVYMSELLHAAAERHGYRYVRCWEQRGGHGIRTERWNTASVWDGCLTDEHGPDVDALPEGAFVPPSWRRRL